VLDRTSAARRVKALPFAPSLEVAAQDKLQSICTSLFLLYQIVLRYNFPSELGACSTITSATLSSATPTWSAFQNTILECLKWQAPDLSQVRDTIRNSIRNSLPTDADPTDTTEHYNSMGAFLSLDL
jgi:hypothetical protein